MKTYTGEMKIVEDYLTLPTKGFCDIQDITDEVYRRVVESGIRFGQVLISIPGATAGVTTIEYEPGLLRDLPELFEKWIPSDQSYHHDKTWHDGNGFSHLRASLVKPSLNIPVSNGNLVLGTWQQIVLLDFDNRPRQRRIFIQVSGI
jgi:secondary thiamine-phosphate synthase enzyme